MLLVLFLSKHFCFSAILLFIYIDKDSSDIFYSFFIFIKYKIIMINYSIIIIIIVIYTC